MVFLRVAVLVVVLLLLLAYPSRRTLCSPRGCSILGTCLPPGVLGESSMSHCIVARALGTPRYWRTLLRLPQAQKQEKVGTIVLRMSDVRPMTMHVWICPHCGYVVAEFSPAKALSAVKLHLERKHYLEI